MTEIEKIAYAKSFIDKLADGLNPLDGKPIPENDIASNPRLSRCFSFVSDILSQVCENGGITKSKRVKKAPFSISFEQLEKFELSESPIPISEIAKRINDAAGNESMKKLSYRNITEWLLGIDMLCLQERTDGKPAKCPTEAGMQIGISTETRTGRYGEYQTVVYNKSAQQFILDNLDAVIACSKK